jgi:site-specific DNA-methyltransferase (adenine-specific)
MKTDLLDIRHADCMDMMREFPIDYFDLAIIDPPYGIGVNVSMGRRKGDEPSSYHKFFGGDKEAPNRDYFEELFRVSKVQVIWGANHFISKIPYDSACWVAWDKGFSDEVTFATFELAWTNAKGTCKMFRGHPNAQDRIHPTQKPVKLYDWLLRNYAKPGDKILDTHLGSGSIAIACHYAGHHLTACELDADYYAAACERIKRETSQLTLNI